MPFAMNWHCYIAPRRFGQAYIANIFFRQGNARKRGQGSSPRLLAQPPGGLRGSGQPLGGQGLALRVVPNRPFRARRFRSPKGPRPRPGLKGEIGRLRQDWARARARGFPGQEAAWKAGSKGGAKGGRSPIRRGNSSRKSPFGPRSIRGSGTRGRSRGNRRKGPAQARRAPERNRALPRKEKGGPVAKGGGRCRAGRVAHAREQAQALQRPCALSLERVGLAPRRAAQAAEEPAAQVKGHATARRKRDSASSRSPRAASPQRGYPGLAPEGAIGPWQAATACARAYRQWAGKALIFRLGVGMCRPGQASRRGGLGRVIRGC